MGLCPTVSLFGMAPNEPCRDFSATTMAADLTRALISRRRYRASKSSPHEQRTWTQHLGNLCTGSSPRESGVGVGIGIGIGPPCAGGCRPGTWVTHQTGHMGDTFEGMSQEEGCPGKRAPLWICEWNSSGDWNTASA